jgi:hypothetical protein
MSTGQVTPALYSECVHTHQERVMANITVKKEELQVVGQNVKAIVVGDNLVLVIDTTTNIGPSSSGKMIGYGSTGGFTPLPGDLKGNIWVGKKA